ncbi:hypothetical protein HOP50_03g22570 [Chloropicon primus]|uniref:Uncharacterized protein n=1 Tax=Chloropicon primus TaxID=1764295 RepID=A0A5B8MK32_9CHLO|nr:hypothetical protein A3770_03p22580 [Chloropicon primus]UPQ98951.1 hypothetical protein HOP50_03g22570 [Chloropicon primus]|eukprot:QDZ19740.1 hypothetical protein A3770_03p22580 [Chloropicon primus]
MEGHIEVINLHETKGNPLDLDETSITRGFENFAHPKLVKQLTSSNLVVRQKSLLAARELISIPEHRVRCFGAGIIGALVDCLAHENLQVQQSAARNFSFLASDAAGCEELLKADAIVALLEATYVGDIDTALECFNSLLVAAKKESVRAFFLEHHKFLDKLLEIAKDTVASSKASSALKLIHLILEGRHNEETVDYLLQSDAIGVCASHLDSTSSDLKHSASTVLAFLSVSDLGKEKAIALGVVEPLLNMALTADKKLQYSSSSCLMALAVANSGKKAISEIDESKLRKCVQNLLDEGTEIIIMNCLQIISAAAEESKIRACLKPFISKLNDMKPSLPKYVASHLNYAVRQLKFLSLPHRLENSS